MQHPVDTPNDCYDPLDPNGNIAVTFDIHEWTTDGYVARVTIQNYYQYRHIDKPGWSLGWEWTNKEVIWSMSGAFAILQGDCASFKFEKPHSCQPNPVIADLLPETLPASRSEDCCRGGVLAAWAIDPSNSFSSFEMKVGNLNINSTVSPPANLTLLAPGPGYTCIPVLETEPTQSSEIGGRRKVQVYRTWKSKCTYSSFLANKKPVCCVSLSTFYNPTVTTCPECSCGCRETGQNSVPCIREDSSSSLSDIIGLDIVKCTDHMCPVRVHWHVKNIYLTHWRVKLTISNYNYKRNYSNWNVLVQHPGFSQKINTYSFNCTLLPTFGFTDKVALFWGLQHYNNELLQSDEKQLGSVKTEILLEKDLSTFTLSNGWALPRRIYFGGEECEMPLPDTFPVLPNGSSSRKLPHCLFLLLIICWTSKITSNLGFDI
ncbi:Protein COBRA precursor, putative [Ricinus communis]|uniref:COBRA-like protein n=1 Tax=Ricinus communis TaxID=3988 RepID=B9STE2_RICCO|nr:Protein COBRA precursor, putative [Ricinus communis]